VAENEPLWCEEKQSPQLNEMHPIYKEEGVGLLSGIL